MNKLKDCAKSFRVGQKEEQGLCSWIEKHLREKLE